MINRIILLLIAFFFVSSCGVSSIFYQDTFIQALTNGHVTYYLNDNGDVYIQGGDSEFVSDQVGQNAD